MHFYKITTGEHDDQTEILLMHEKEYDEYEFRDIVREADSKYSDQQGFMDVSIVLVEDYGFKEVHCEARAHYIEWVRKWE